MDAYRLSGPADIVDLGSRELFFEDSVSVVEWADRIERALPPDRLDIRFDVTGVESRRITLSASGDLHGKMLGKLAGLLALARERNGT